MPDRRRAAKVRDISVGPQMKTKEKCDANKSGGGKCGLTAGYGTDHPGIGRCRYHGGRSPSHVKAAAKQEMRMLLGKPMEINAVDALIMCIKIRAGEVEWLGQKMATLDAKDWVEDTLAGKQFHLFARERQAAMRDLARYAEMAIRLGLTERAVKMAEQYGETLANLLKGIGDAIWAHLDEEGKAKYPTIVRQHLVALDGGKTGDATKLLPSAEGVA